MKVSTSVPTPAQKQTTKAQKKCHVKSCGRLATTYEIGKNKVKVSLCAEHLIELAQWLEVLKKGEEVLVNGVRAVRIPEELRRRWYSRIP